jgi:squalene synthase HpnC
MAVGHYENFPVASVLLPPQVRPAVATIYAFARTADDFADEGDLVPAERLAKLDHYRDELRRIAEQRSSESPLFQSLAAVIRDHALPIQPFHDLLDAFTQDVMKGRYADFNEVLDYCRRSANPIGALLLRLFGATNPQHLRWSDAICTALQLVNFWQDIALDFKKGRIYVPQNEMVRFGVTEAQIADGRTDDAWQALMSFQVARARAMLESGVPLAHALRGRIGWELRMVVQGGLRILERIESVKGDVFRRRPLLRAPDWVLMLWRAAVAPAFRSR